MTNRAISMLTAVFTIAICSSSQAVPTTYTDRTSWLSGIGGSSDFLVDFNGYTVDTPLVGTMDFGPFSVQSDGGRSVDVPPYENSDATYGNGTPNLSLFVNGINDAIFDFDSPVYALFADFWAPGNSGSPLEMLLSFSTGGSTVLNIGDFGSSTTSFGFISDTSITQITLFNARNDGFNVDDIEGSYMASVPEPSILFLMMAGMAGFGFASYKRKKA